MTEVNSNLPRFYSQPTQQSSGTSPTLPSESVKSGKTETTPVETTTASVSVTETTTTSISDTQTNVVQKYSYKELTSKYRLTYEIINKYFDVDKNGLYTLKPNCGYSDINALKCGLYEEYKNMLILNNFLTGKVTDSDGKETKNALKTASDGTLLTTWDIYFSKYAEEIGKLTPEDAQNLRQEALNKLITQFSLGNLAVNQVRTILKAIGVTDIKQTTQGKNYVFTFKYGDKEYKSVVIK